jgi:hypothetical protein
MIFYREAKSNGLNRGGGTANSNRGKWPGRVGKSDFVSRAMQSTRNDFYRKAGYKKL